MLRDQRSNATGVKLIILEYLLRHFVLSIFACIVIGTARFIGGRDVFVGGRKTDATFWRGARLVRGTWWASLPGYARTALRFAVITAFVMLATGQDTLVLSVGCLAAVWLAVVGVRRFRHHRYVKKVLQPFWPAVAGIIGVPQTDPPDAWMHIPTNTTTDPIVVGLRAEDPDDERRVGALVQLFDQRFGGPFAGQVDYRARLVSIRPRPTEHPEWPAVAGIIGVSPAQLAADWMTFVHDSGQLNPDNGQPVLTVIDPPTDEADDKRRTAELEADDTRLLVTLPHDAIDDRDKANTLAMLFRDRLDVGRWQVSVDHARRAVTLQHVAQPPKHVAFGDYAGIDKLRDTQIYTGKYYDGSSMVMDFEAMESPSTAVIGGAGSGKTTFLANAIAQVASKGAIAIVIDPKFRFRKIFGNELPNVVIFDDTREMRTEETPEWEQVMLFCERVMEDRLDVDNIPAEELARMKPEDIPNLHDRAKFPTIYLFIDEGGPFRLLTDANWRLRKDADLESGSEPRIADTELTLLMRGREARVFCMKAMHQANANNFPEGTEGRQLYGNRLVLGTDVEQQSWQMAAGAGRSRPHVPSYIGAGIHLKGASMRQLQAAEIKHAFNKETRTNEAIELARQGIPVLRELDLINDRGALVLPGYGELRPAILGRTVPGTGTTSPYAAKATPPVNKTESSASDSTGQGTVENVPEKVTENAEELPITGMKSAVEFLMTTAGLYEGYSDPHGTFKRARERHSIPGEFEVAGRPAWHRFDLKEWGLQQRTRSKPRKQQGKQPGTESA